MRIIGNNPAADNAEITAVASGTLPDGKAVIVNADGTVSVVAGSDQAVGTPVAFETGPFNDASTAFDSTNNKVVISYVDQGNSNYGTAIVGTIDPSDNSISFGTPVVFESAVTVETSTVFDSASNKVVIAYRDSGNSNYGTAIVGTVSGTNISFGTAAVFESANTTDISCTFDSNSNKVVIAYADAGNSNYGTAVVGTVSGTNISFGSAVVFQTQASDKCAITFDSNSNKVVVAYQNDGNSGYGTAIVGTVSGTGISFGTAVVFSAASSDNISLNYDANAQKVVIAYRNLGNSYYGTAIVGTVSGTGISFGTAVVFNAGNSQSSSVVYDANAQKVVVCYTDQSDSLKGKAIVGIVSGTSISFADPTVFESGSAGQIAGTYDSNSQRIAISYNISGNGTTVVFQNASTTLTAENFIGFTDGAAADTGPARVQIGSGINTAQSSLTAGQQYFVQTDGTLGLTADDPSVIAGTAISATEIIVKG